MGRGRASVVVLLLVFAALAATAGSTLEEPEFQLISGVEWAEQVKAGLAPPQAAAAQQPVPSPPIASGLILLAGGLIITVAVLGAHARSRLTPVRVRAR